MVAISTRADAAANYHPAVAPEDIEVEGYASVGDFGAALYKKVSTEPSHGGKFSITLSGGGTAWYELAEPVVRPEMFGASRNKSTVSTTPLAAMVSYVNATSAPIELSAIYRSTSPLEFTCNSLIISGTTSQNSGFVFQGCHGIRLDHSGFSSPMTRYRLSDFCLLTTVQSLYDGFAYTGPDSAGGGLTMREIHGMHAAGEGFFDLAGNVLGQPLAIRAAGWLNAFKLTNSDNTHIDYCRIHGSWQEWQNNNPDTNPKFPNPTTGINSENSTGLFCLDVQVFYVKDAFKATGQCEGINIIDCGGVAVWRGITCTGLDAPSNNFKILRNHMSAYECAIDIGSDRPNQTMMHIIEGNLPFFYPRNEYNSGFVHMKLGVYRSVIKDNHIYVSPNDDPVLRDILGMDLNGNSNIVQSNIFERCNVAIRTGTSASQNLLISNYTVASFNVSTVAPLVDDGTGTTCMLNDGDKRTLWPATISNPNSSIDLWSSSAVNVYGGAAGARYTKLALPNIAGSPVNHAEILPANAGGSPRLRAAGDDTNVDLLLEGKGTGLVRFGTRVAAADAPITGYIQIKDNSGVARKLAIIA